MSHLALKPTVPSYLVELAGVDTHIKRVFRAPDSVFSCSGKTQLLLNHAYAVAEAGGSVLVIRSHAASPTDAMLFKGLRFAVDRARLDHTVASMIGPRTGERPRAKLREDM